MGEGVIRARHSLSEALGVSVNTLLGSEIEETEEENSVKILAAKLELLNEQFARQNEKKRIITRIILITLLVLIGIIVIIDLAPILSIALSADKSIEIIGGADGPTSIFVATRGHNYIRIIILICIGIGAMIGLIKTKRN